MDHMGATVDPRESWAVIRKNAPILYIKRIGAFFRYAED